MNGLPASVEAYLTDAGFSVTEILVLKRLLEGEAMTLRELGAKTGKSSGVLDQATKKLLQRKIISREIVNDTPKVVLKSLDAIVRWMQEDMEGKLKLMHSRAKDFESFISSLKQEATRPEIEYFEGDEGVEKAYMKLLLLGEKEMLCFVPALIKEEDDPLCAFRVQYFRERRKRGIFARVLSQETSLGRRYQGRDAFEYRKTVLVPESVYPLNFEKIVIDGTIACFNHGAKQACFLHYPELAAAERKMFEILWRTAPDGSSALGAAATPVVPQDAISLRTRLSSSFREFLLSRKSLTIFAMSAVLAGMITFGLYRHNYNLNIERVREQAMAIAATAAIEFDVRDIDQLHTAEDVKKPEFQKIVKHLQLIRSQNENVKYIFIYRPTGMKNPAWEVVADANYGTPDEDWNGNGIIDESEQLTIPGQEYPYEDPNFQEVIKKPTAVFVKDEWGEYFDATAPIFDSQGKTVAILGVDIDVQEVKNLTNESFAAAFIFFSLFFLFVFIRLAAFNRSLFIELLRILRSKTVLIILGLCALISLAVTFGMWRHNYNLNLQRERERAMSIVATGAMQFDAKDLDQLHTIDDVKKPEYVKVIEKLNVIRFKNERVAYAWIMRPVAGKKGYWEYVADADSLDPSAKIDANRDGVINEKDALQYPGQFYDEYDPFFEQAISATYSTPSIHTDQFGKYFTTTALIRDVYGNTTAIFGIDIKIREVSILTYQSFSFLICFVGFFLLLIFVRIIAFNLPLFSAQLR
ncbi:MAG: hypothetical protein PHE68_06250 [Candidatus Peribacteraceae bacterium]|nr:hypothetical protein [Candidatus Peribacteraceae bacterium]